MSGGALTKSAKDSALPAPAELLRCAEDTLLMVMEGKVKIVCTGSEGCVLYEAPSSTSASKQSPQSSASRLRYNGKAPIIIQMPKFCAWRREQVKPLGLYRIEKDREVDDMWASHQFEFNSEYIISQYLDWLERFRLVRVVCGDTVLWRCGHASLRWQAASAGKHRSGGGVSISYQFANAVFLSRDLKREIHALHWSRSSPYPTPTLPFPFCHSSRVPTLALARQPQ